jgi:hypothetical protein
MPFRQTDPWAKAPPWARELRDMLGLALKLDIVIMTAVDDVLTQAETAAHANSDAEDAVMVLLTTLSKAIADLKAGSTDPAVVARIQALADSLTAKAAALAAATVANTPAA